jgi:hypothetical protein
LLKGAFVFNWAEVNIVIVSEILEEPRLTLPAQSKLITLPDNLQILAATPSFIFLSDIFFSPFFYPAIFLSISPFTSFA